MYFSKGLIDEESWLDVLLNSNTAKKITAQKSQIINKDNGEVYEFQNRKFPEWVVKEENKEAYSYCKQKVKEALIIEQDPVNSGDNVVEKLGEDEVI